MPKVASLINNKVAAYLKEFPNKHFKVMGKFTIRQHLQVGPIWVSIDESTDVDGRYMGNVIVGELSLSLVIHFS